MSQYSKLPEIHEFLNSIPFTISWNKVITTYPSLSHIQWAIFFSLIAALLQLISYLISKLTARRLIGYDKYPPLPLKSKVSLSSYYLKLGQHVNYKKHIKINSYNIQNLCKKFTDSNLSTSEIKSWFVSCNEFHAKNRLQRKKFQEYLFPIITKIIVLSFGIYSVYDKQWIYDRSQFYDGWPNHQNLEYIPDIKLLYLFHTGFYMYRIISSLLIDRKLKDFIAQVIHHWVSLILIILSYYCGLIRIGVVILLLHDPADIVLQSAKFFKLIQMEALCNFFFALLCVTWLSTRIIIYPYHCMLSGFIDFWRLHSGCDMNVRITAYVLTGLMCILYCLHLHWFKLLVQAIIRIIKGKGIVDGRSGNESSDNEGDNKPT
eukprot:349291_1